MRVFTKLHTQLLEFQVSSILPFINIFFLYVACSSSDIYILSRLKQCLLIRADPSGEDPLKNDSMMKRERIKYVLPLAGVSVILSNINK